TSTAWGRVANLVFSPCKLLTRGNPSLKSNLHLQAFPASRGSFPFFSLLSLWACIMPQIASRNSQAVRPDLVLSEQPSTVRNFWKKIRWVNTIALIGTPLLSLYALYSTPIHTKTLIWSIIWYYCTGLGITAGYHRLWAHRSYSASLSLRIVLMLVASGAAQGSIRWWSAAHRNHHRFTDTEKDPYSMQKGFFHAHMGWIMMTPDPKKKGRSDISDLDVDPLVKFQHRHFTPIMIFMGFILPCVVAGYGWGDFRGGFFFAGILRLVVVHHATFCVNSLAHWIGDQPFDDRLTPRDHVLTAFATLGEGYHNFHHEFPIDYRNAIEWYQYDPTKWLIRLFHVLGLASGLRQFPSNEIQKGIVQQRQKKLDQWRGRLDWGVPVDQLPVIEYDDYIEAAKEKNLILMSGVVHDVTDFISSHPGGKALIKSGIGKDMTAAFNGGVYDHSNAAHNLLATMRVGVVRGGMQVEIRKRGQKEGKFGELDVLSRRFPHTNPAAAIALTI
ncbi:Acyl-CoA desaturase, partial [Neolecta irregularis DAH-3]